MCEVSCGLEMQVENNKIINVRPDPDSPRSDNYCCRKGRAAKYYQDNKERLNYPLKRVGDDYVRISWETAYREIGEKARAIIDKHGPRSFGVIGGTLASSQSAQAMFYGLLGGVGSQFLFNPVGVEFMGSWWSNGRIYGDQVRAQDPDEHTTDVLLLWGCNTYVTHNMGSARKVIRHMSESPDKKVIVIDPRLTESARMADIHVAPRVGTDALLMKTMIAIILEEGWQNQGFIDKWCRDFNQIKAWFKDVDIKKNLKVCQVPYKQIKEFTKILCTENWAVHQDLGLFCGRHSTLNSYLVLTLAVITGSMLVPKNNIAAEPYLMLKQSDEKDPNTWRTKDGRFPVTGVYPSGSLAGQILNEDDDRIRVMFSSMSNPARSFPNSKNMRKALEKLELFVADDICMTETTRLADYVLPATSGYEGHDFNFFQENFPHTVCQLKRPIVEAEGERKESTEIWLDVADAMGLIPDLPKDLYKKAEGATKEKDRVPYTLALLKYLALNKKQMDIAPLIIGKTLGKAMGSVTKSMMYAGLITSPLMGTGKIENAGIIANTKHPFLSKIPKIKEYCLMDEVFQRVLDTPEGLIIATNDTEDVDAYIREHIRHKDKKFHLYCDEINDYIKFITPEREEAELNQYPMVLSAGRHTDVGVNTVMKNPATYVHRKPFTAIINPEDAKALNIKDGEIVRLVTKAGEALVPVECTYQASKGYTMIPQHFGLLFGGKVRGVGANEFTSEEDRDALTGNPLIRFTPCRIEKVKRGKNEKIV
jgi:anaerobic selenocysteine-containing dehydrogenase